MIKITDRGIAELYDGYKARKSLTIKMEDGNYVKYFIEEPCGRHEQYEKSESLTMRLENMKDLVKYLIHDEKAISIEELAQKECVN